MDLTAASSSALAAPKFAFFPLRTEDSIRVLELLPAASLDDVLRARLAERALPSVEDKLARDIPTLDYEALSYAWGSDPPCEALLIECGDGGGGDASSTPAAPPPPPVAATSSMAITPSLATALRRLRPVAAAPARRLWVDAVCIDQANAVEKSAQVARMAGVYRQARRVLVWLGESTAGGVSARVLDVLRNAAGRAEEFGIATSWLSFTGRKLKGEWADCYALLQTALGVPLADVLGRAWFTRLWIVQEVVLARDAVVLVGELEMDWESFTAGMAVFHAGMHTCQAWTGAAREDYDAFLRAWRVVDAVAENKVWAHVYTSGVYTNVRRVLQTLRGQQCTDERDRVYAIRGLGLSPLRRTEGVRADGELAPSEIVPDYTKPAAQVFIHFARHMVKQNDVYMLHDAGLSNRLPRSDYGKGRTVAHDPALTKPEDVLPSWVPDLSDPGAFASAPWMASTAFEAGGLGRWAKPALMDDRPGSLYVQVRRLGILSRVMFPDRTLQRYGAARDLSHAVRQFWGRVTEEADALFYARYEPLSWGGSLALRLALARTLAADGRGAVFEETFGFHARADRWRTREGVLELFDIYDRCSLNLDAGPDDDDARGELFRRWEAVRAGAVGDGEFEAGMSEECHMAAAFEGVVQNTFADNSFVITDHGYMGIAPAMAELTDEVVLIAGHPTPYVLREVKSTAEEGDGGGEDDAPNAEQRFVAIGPAYVHGFMYGEGALSGTSGPTPQEWILPSPHFRYVCLV